MKWAQINLPSQCIDYKKKNNYKKALNLKVWQVYSIILIMIIYRMRYGSIVTGIQQSSKVCDITFKVQ